jgi:hypothetical protein
VHLWWFAEYCLCRIDDGNFFELGGVDMGIKCLDVHESRDCRSVADFRKTLRAGQATSQTTHMSAYLPPRGASSNGTPDTQGCSL